MPSGCQGKGAPFHEVDWVSRFIMAKCCQTGDGKKNLMLVGDYAENDLTMVPFQTQAAVGHGIHCGNHDRKDKPLD
jgi:hypothetical protein